METRQTRMDQQTKDAVAALRMAYRTGCDPYNSQVAAAACYVVIVRRSGRSLGVAK